MRDPVVEALVDWAEEALEYRVMPYATLLEKRLARAILAASASEHTPEATEGWSPGAGERLDPIPFIVEPFEVRRAGTFCVGVWHGKPWLLWKHPDGQWVTKCKVDVSCTPGPDREAEIRREERERCAKVVREESWVGSAPLNRILSRITEEAPDAG